MNGEIDQKQEFNFVVKLKINDKSTCTGFLINPETVITAAHCIVTADGGTGYSLHKIEVYDGPEETIEVYKTDLTNVHSDYLKESQVGSNTTYTRRSNFDVGFVKLKRPIELDFYPSLELDESFAKEVNKQESLIAVGYGLYEKQKSICLDKMGRFCLWKNKKGHTTSKERRFTEILINKKLSIERNFWVSETSYNQLKNFFTYGVGNLGQTAQGDSGGPLLRKSDKTVIGLTIEGLRKSDLDISLYKSVKVSNATFLPFQSKQIADFLLSIP